jgi:hypothetical protein
MKHNLFALMTWLVSEPRRLMFAVMMMVLIATLVLSVGLGLDGFVVAADAPSGSP